MSTVFNFNITKKELEKLAAYKIAVQTLLEQKETRDAALCALKAARAKLRKGEK